MNQQSDIFHEKASEIELNEVEFFESIIKFTPSNQETLLECFENYNSNVDVKISNVELKECFDLLYVNEIELMAKKKNDRKSSSRK